MKKKKKSGKKEKMWDTYFQVVADQKKIEFTFATKADEQEYRSICEDVWGDVPLEVPWATTTLLYQERLNNKKLQNET